MWLQCPAFQCLVDRHWGQSHIGVGWYLPKGRYWVILGQDIRLEWGPLQMVHSSLGLTPLGLLSVLSCLFVFWSSLLSSFPSVLLTICEIFNHICSSRCMSLWSMSGSLSGLFVVWDFLGTCWVFLGGVWGYVLNHPCEKSLHLDWTY